MQTGVGAIPTAAEGWAGNCPELGREITIPCSIGFWAVWLPHPQPPGSWDGAKRVNSKQSSRKKGEESSEKEEEKGEENEKEKERGKRDKKKKEEKEKKVKIIKK